jgi:hypothetical protein
MWLYVNVGCWSTPGRRICSTGLDQLVRHLGGVFSSRWFLLVFVGFASFGGRMLTGHK